MHTPSGLNFFVTVENLNAEDNSVPVSGMKSFERNEGKEKNG